MASIRKEISTKAKLDDVWNALRDVGALHTRLVPGFVPSHGSKTGGWIMTFGNGTVVHESNVTIDKKNHRIVWSTVGTFCAS